MDRKLHDSRGETLVEVLASILISALSVALLFGGIMASVRMDKTAAEADEVHYAMLSAAETQEETPAARTGLEIEGGAAGTGGASPKKTFSVDLYGGGGMYSYALAPEGAPP